LAQLPGWFDAVRKLNNPNVSAYLQILLLTGARPGEVQTLKWEDINWRWESIVIRDKIEGERTIPLTPYVAHLLAALPRRNEYVFSSTQKRTPIIGKPHLLHKQACGAAGLQDLTLHGLRRSFASLAEQTEAPGGVAAQIQGHKPQSAREKSYIVRPLDFLRKWHFNIEAWILEQAHIEFTPTQAGLRAVK
jgi:integrase